MVRRVRFQAGSSLHLFGVELEEVCDDFGFVRVGRKAVGGRLAEDGSPHRSAAASTRSAP